MAQLTVSKYTTSSRFKMLSYLGVAIGVATMIGGFLLAKDRVWPAFLVNLFYFTSLALGGLFFTAIQYVTKAGWSATIRRISESLTSFLPFAFIGALAICFLGAKSVFPWLNPEIVNADEMISKKTAYLNFGFLAVRTVIFFLLWIGFAKLIVGNSLAQDKKANDSLTLRNVKLSIGFLIVFALSYSLFSVDYIMSLDPKWFSTIFGVYCFAGLFQSTLALVTILTIYLMRKGLLKGFVNENHLHDMGKFLFAFTIFYAYIGFSQFMLIWYANLPEETIFYLHRMHGNWYSWTVSILVFKFIVPFFLLLPREAKRDENHLIRVSVLLLIMQWVDFYWLIYPNFNEGEVAFGVWEVGTFLGFAGVAALAWTRFMSNHSAVAVNDPYIHEALHHHV